MSEILAEVEINELKGMTTYWREVFQRDNLKERQCIATMELQSVISLIGEEKILRIINAYVNRVIDEARP